MMLAAAGPSVRRASTRPAPVAPSWSVNPSATTEAVVGLASVADPGVYDGSQPITAAYQWQTSSDSGVTPADISGATSLTSPVWVSGDANAGVRKRFKMTLDGRGGAVEYTTAWEVVAGSPGGSGSATATGATEITFSVTTESVYAGVEWGVSPDYTYSVFDAELSTTHTLVIDGRDGVVGATTYAWRAYITSDPLDAPSNRTYLNSGTVVTA